MNYGILSDTSPLLEGVAVWHPSDRSTITLWRGLRSGGMALQRGLGREKMKRLLAFSDRVDLYHQRHAPYPHCYLFFIWIDPGAQGKGYASRLIRPMLERLDRENTACYLNTQNEENIPIYEHFGFSVIEQVTLPGTAIAHTGMIRRLCENSIDS